jgi:hypothetical protein
MIVCVRQGKINSVSMMASPPSTVLGESQGLIDECNCHRLPWLIRRFIFPGWVGGQVIGLPYYFFAYCCCTVACLHFLLLYCFFFFNWARSKMNVCLLSTWKILALLMLILPLTDSLTVYLLLCAVNAKLSWVELR